MLYHFHRAWQERQESKVLRESQDRWYVENQNNYTNQPSLESNNIWYSNYNNNYWLFVYRVQQVRMAAQGLLGLLEPGVSQDQWDCLDLKVSA